MDYCCLQNFFREIPKTKVCIVESPYKKWENLQNSLLASPPNNPFWLELVNTSAIYKSKGVKDTMLLTGPQLVDTVYNTYLDKGSFYVMPYDKYNPRMEDAEKNIYTIHLLTNTWIHGKDGHRDTDVLRNKWIDKLRHI
jgi:hypothetical protein